ncbi:diaminopimelate decarboxylase, partial [candidate division KSB1 bacterium]|nr:diaminopimelate decarboxylase [candidate division KSB1 bacterium]
MNTRPKNQAISNTLKKALHAGLITGEDSAIIFYDLSMLIDRIKHIKDIFPENTLHAIAVKANPLIKILKMLNTEGTGLETASLPEVYLAREAGFDASRIVFDSPAKTEHELKIALEMGVNINIDSFQELDRVAKLVTQYPQHGIIGLRINPQVGLGKIKSSSVAGEYSKFGVPLKEFREEIISSYKKYSWLNGIHLHVGSQGCPIEMLVEGVKRVYDLAMEINTLVGSQDLIKVFDMGGGLPVSYHFDAPSTDPRDYIDMLSTACPSLFDGTFSLVTEFGRYASANAGWTASR